MLRQRASNVVYKLSKVICKTRSEEQKNTTMFNPFSRFDVFDKDIKLFLEKGLSDVGEFFRQIVTFQETNLRPDG